MLVLGTTMIITTVFYLSPFTASFPTSFSKPGGPLNDFIKHYEAAFYDSERIAFEHRRLRRAAAALNKSVAMYPLKITISTKHREFKLLLQADDSLFAENAVFEGEGGKPIHFDSRKAYVGTLENDETAKVRGILTKEGLFDGTISTGLEEYYIEPVNRYQNASTPANDKGDSGFDYHTIVYRTSDVLHPNSGSLCASARLHRSRSSSSDRDQNSRAFRRKRRDKRSTKVPPMAANDKESSASAGSDSNVLYDLDFSGNSYFLKNSSGVRRKGKSGIGIGSTTVSASADKPAAASNLEYNMYHNVDKMLYLPAEQYYSKRNIAVDPKKTTCMLYLQADHLFFEKYGTEETCIEVMTRHVQRVNSIYRNTDFNQDGKPDNISFMIKRIKVHSLKDPSYRFPGNYGVEKFLELFSEEDYDAFCLAYMFTYRDFEMGTLGLAWTGDLRNAGGVCEKNGHYRGSLKSLNTGIVTVLNYGKHVPSAVSHVTLAHEIGHNFGSPHDPEGCTPGGEDGNFIMFARATSGDKKNNNKFSPCSLSAIDPVLNVKARSSRGCFTTPQRSICGNGVVEPGEECDCGWEEDCKDTCCFPQRRYAPPDEPPCRLTPNAVCSPSQGPCCTAECKIKYGDLCRTDNGCRDASYCDGKNPICPPSINKPNKTVCNEEFVCYMGECTGSICLAYGLESCQCIPTPSDPPTKACELCCKLPGENQPCLSSFLWNTAPYDVPDMFSKPGTPCNEYNGYCDVFKRCREVDPSGPLATLRKLLLSEENIASFKKWAIDHWYYTASIVMTFILIVVLSTKYLGKNPKMKSVTVMHKAPTEIVRLPTDNSAAVVVHPVAVRSKLPLKKKVRESSNRHLTENNSNNNNNNNNSGNGNSNNNNNNNKGGGAGVAERANGRSAGKPVKSSGAAAANNNYHRDNEAAKKHRRKMAKSKNCDNLVLYSTKINVEEDPIGKVRNWLISSQNAAGNLNSSLRKSKSTPTLSSNPAEISERNEQDASRNAAAAPAKPVSDRKSKCALTKDGASAGTTQQMRLQVLYKPPFKFSLKLRKNRPTPEVSSQLVKDNNGTSSNFIGAVRRMSEVNKQKPVQTPLRVDRIRPPAATTTKAPNDNNNNNSKNDGSSKTAVVSNNGRNDKNDASDNKTTIAHRNDSGIKVAVIDTAKNDSKTAPPVNNGRSSKANAHKKRKPISKEDAAKSTHDSNWPQNHHPTKTEFRRSQSAPQPSEPIYENTVSCQLPNSSSSANTLPRNDHCEPHYANLGSSASAHVANDNSAADKLPFIANNVNSNINTNATKLTVYDRRSSKRRHNNNSSSSSNNNNSNNNNNNNNNNNSNNNNNNSSSSSNRHLQRSSSALASTKQSASSQQRNRSTVTDRSSKRHSLQHNLPPLPLSSAVRLSQRRNANEPSAQLDDKNTSTTTAEKQYGAGSNVNLCATNTAPHTVPSDLEVLVSDNENSLATPS